MIDNETFGKLEYDYIWYGKEKILFGRKEEIIILVGYYIAARYFGVQWE